MVRIDPTGPLIVQIGAATDLAVDAAIAGTGIMLLCSRTGCGPISTMALSSLCSSRGGRNFDGPFLYFPGRRLVPAPLRAFIDFVRASPHQF